jgi:hypothetical protein
VLCGSCGAGLGAPEPLLRVMIVLQRCNNEDCSLKLGRILTTPGRLSLP